MTTLPTPDQAKAMARALRADLATDGVAMTHSRVLELVAHAHGLADWNTLVGLDRTSGAPSGTHRGTIGRPIPVVRILDVPAAYAFYVDFLGCRVDWEHRYEHGVGNLAELRRRPSGKQRPGVEADAPGGPTTEVVDPFGNRLRFCTPTDGVPAVA